MARGHKDVTTTCLCLIGLEGTLFKGCAKCCGRKEHSFKTLIGVYCPLSMDVEIKGIHLSVNGTGIGKVRLSATT